MMDGTTTEEMMDTEDDGETDDEGSMDEGPTDPANAPRAEIDSQKRAAVTCPLVTVAC